MHTFDDRLGIISDRYTGVGRAKAFAAYGVAGGLAGVVGPIAAGTILGAAEPDLGWRLVLLLNVPFALLTLVGGAVLLRRDRSVCAAVRFDVVGLVVLATATLLLLLPMVSSAGSGRAVVFVAGSLAMLVVFWWWERRYARSGGTLVLLARAGGRAGLHPWRGRRDVLVRRGRLAQHCDDSVSRPPRPARRAVRTCARRRPDGAVVMM
jgi:MFS family permease